MIPNQYQRPDISATGDVTLVRPDVAYVSLYICADGILLEDAVREASSKAEQVLGALRDAYGSEIKDIQVKDVYAGEGKPAIGLHTITMSNDYDDQALPREHCEIQRTLYSNSIPHHPSALEDMGRYEATW